MKRHPIINLTLGVVFGVSGVLLGAAGGYWIYKNQDAVTYVFNKYELNANYVSRDAATEVCTSQLGTIGLEVQAVQQGQILVGLNDFPQPETATAISSLATYVCDAHELDYFCLGSECESPLMMRFSYKDAN